MDEIREKLATVSRLKLLRFIAQGVHGFTIMARDPHISDVRKAQINNRIHYLTGHMIKLLDDKVECTSSILDDIVTQVSVMNSSLYRNMLSHLEG